MFLNSILFMTLYTDYVNYSLPEELLVKDKLDTKECMNRE